ncbi:MAG: DUF4019 domain-containing protein [Flavobacteriales bacterium]|nr:DUF4019 domain-containing protein [Flavobacteriales bacterium]
MKKTLITFIISIFFVNSSFSQINIESQLQESSKSAIIWLNNINSENYSQAYTGLSDQITTRFDSLDWISGVDQMMVSFGEFGGRREVSREFKSSMEGLPDGYYAVFQYESNYKNTLQHSEQLILHQDDKRNWRILDYSYEFKDGEGYIEE